MVQYSLVCVDPAVDSRVALADASGDTLMPAVGIVERVLGDGRVLVEGRHGITVTNAGWTWTRGDALYANPASPGGITATLPATGALQRIGHAGSSTSIVVGIEQEILV